MTEDSVELTAMMRNAQSQFQEIIKLSPALSEQVKIAALNTEDPGHFADLIAVNLNLNLEERQKLLETASVKERLTRLLPMLNREHEVLTLSSKIQTEVATSISKTQRDFFLREQMRAIQRELGESDPNAGEIRALREKIEQTPLPAEAKTGRHAGTGTAAADAPAAAEYAVTPALPGLDSEPALEKGDRGQARSGRGRAHSQRAALRPDEGQGSPAGVSGRHQAPQADQRARFSAWSARPAWARPPWAGAWPMRWAASSPASPWAACATKPRFAAIAAPTSARCPAASSRRLRRVESRNPVILLDELDKVGADFRGDPASALLEVLDPAQNNTFTDHYLDLPFDLSRVLFITTANWLEPIHPALRDRLEVIELPSYTETEKLQIAKRYLVPRQLEEHGLTRQEVKIPGRHPAAADPGLHARSRRAAAGARNRRAHAQSHPQDRQQRPVAQAARAQARSADGLPGRGPVRHRDGRDDQGIRHCHRPGLDAGRRRNSVHRGHPHARQRRACC